MYGAQMKTAIEHHKTAIDVMPWRKRARLNGIDGAGSGLAPDAFAKPWS
jgi:hypothetical protein